jgi:septum formation protein
MPTEQQLTAPFEYVYLASQSPRRQELLQQLGIGFQLLPPESDEDAEALEAELPGEAAAMYVRRVCLAKAEAAARRLTRLGHTAAPILVADTTVALDRAILGKPVSDDNAVAMLTRLSGRTHHVLTAVAVVPATGATTETPITSTLSVSTVRFVALTKEQIVRYVANGEPRGKAGAYGVQGRAAEFIAHIDGSYSGIMGLPLFETAALVRAAGVAF